MYNTERPLSISVTANKEYWKSMLAFADFAYTRFLDCVLLLQTPAAHFVTNKVTYLHSTWSWRWLLAVVTILTLQFCNLAYIGIKIV